MTTSFKRSLRVVGAARRQWSLGWEDPPLHGLTDPDRHEAETCCAGHHGFALFERGEVESGRATQWGKGSRHRKGEEPSLALRGRRSASKASSSVEACSGSRPRAPSGSIT